MVMIAPGRDERRLGPVPLHQRETEHAAVEGERPVEVGHLQVNVPDPRAGIDRPIRLTLVRHGPQGFGGHAKPPVGSGMIAPRQPLFASSKGHLQQFSLWGVGWPWCDLAWMGRSRAGL